MGLLSPSDVRRKTKRDEGGYELFSPALSSTSFTSESYYTSSSGSSDASSDDGCTNADVRAITLDNGDDPTKRNTRSAVRSWARRDPLLVTSLVITLGTGIGLFIAFPFPTTVHVFAGASTGLIVWTLVSWARIVFSLSLASLRGSPKGLALPRGSPAYFITLIVSSVLILYWLTLGLVPRQEEVPPIGHADGSPAKYFIAANLYNNEEILPRWSREMVKLAQHLGPDKTFISIYESNSEDRTVELLDKLGSTLDKIGVRHRIVHEDKERWWAYGVSAQRIGFLADARNKALEPLQSANSSLRLGDYDDFTKVLFFNDVVFSWQSAVRLLATSADDTPGEDGYDLACGIDYFAAGLYDTWVARDICGTPMRLSWPHVKDPVTKALVAQNKPFPVSACWNGVVAFPAGPYLYSAGSQREDTSSSHAKRGWKMIDDPTYDSPDLRMSPPLQSPLQFRTSGVEACDHSECFLFSYDLHRLYNNPAHPPRILMNPDVRTAYHEKWWAWRNVVLRIPAVEWWQRHWSHGVPFRFVDWIWESASRRRDFCTWSALRKNAPDRCPALPGALSRGWDT